MDGINENNDMASEMIRQHLGSLKLFLLIYFAVGEIQCSQYKSFRLTITYVAPSYSRGLARYTRPDQ